MAIRTQGIVTVDDSRNFFLNNLTFSDSSSVSSLGLVPGSLKWVLDNPNAYSTSVDDSFGLSVSISGNYAIVGANLEDDSGGTTSGKAYIFNVTTGALVHTLNNPNAYGTSASDRFGESVSISGNYAIVGANNEDESGGTASGKAYIFNVTTGNLLWTLNNPNAYTNNPSDFFATTVSMSGNYAIVGAWAEDDSGGTESGKAYIFNVTTGALIHTLNNPNAYSTSAGDYFGNSVSISGNYAIVGANLEDDSGGTTSGKAYIFNVSTGALIHTLNNPNAYSTSASDFFSGDSLSISGNYAIVGAYDEDDSGGTGSGKAYIFNVTTGALVHTLNNPNGYGTSAGDAFGYSVSISGNYAIVGAYDEDDSGGTLSGKAYIFNVTTGALVHTLNNPNAYSTSDGDFFGISVSISDNYVLVGAHQEDDSIGVQSGKAYIYNLTTPERYTGFTSLGGLEKITDQNTITDRKSLGALIHTLNNPNAYGTSFNDTFGNSVSISGNYVIVGANNEDDSGGPSGKVYIFNVSTGALVSTLDNPNAFGLSGDYFGDSVSISGNYAIVGTPQEDDSGGGSSGKAYIFNVTTGALIHTLNNPNAYSTSAGDEFGYSVSISGNYAIVGAYREDDSGGTQSGKAYIFNVTTGSLVWTLNNPSAYSTSLNDGFGISVSISGNYAIVGAWTENDSGGNSSGKAYIFNVTTGSLVHTLNNPNAYSTSVGDIFGVSVAISGNYAIVGAYDEDDSGGTSSGKAYIFNVTTGALVHTLNNPNAYSTSAGDVFGISVSISGNYAIVGAYFEDDAGGTGSGKAYIFNVTTGALVHTLNNPNAYSTSVNDYFGISVSISGNYAIVGAYAEADSGGDDSGKAYIFSINNLNYNSLEDRLISLFHY